MTLGLGLDAASGCSTGPSGVVAAAFLRIAATFRASASAADWTWSADSDCLAAGAVHVLRVAQVDRVQADVRARHRDDLEGERDRAARSVRRAGHGFRGGLVAYVRRVHRAVLVDRERVLERGLIPGVAEREGVVVRDRGPAGVRRGAVADRHGLRDAADRADRADCAERRRGQHAETDHPAPARYGAGLFSVRSSHFSP